MVNIIYKEQLENGMTMFLYENGENKQVIICIGISPFLHKIYAVPKDKVSDVVKIIQSGKYPNKYLAKPKDRGW